MSIKVLSKFAKAPAGYAVIDTTSRGGLNSQLSPFLLGPVDLYLGYQAENMENGWQFAKVYKQHLDRNGNIDQSYYDWAIKGFEDKKAHRYPMGKGAVPEFSLWDGRRLGYIDARKTIYGPLYGKAVVHTKAFKTLADMNSGGVDIALLDYDGYDHDKLNMSLTEVLHEPKKKMGHAFVLKALLTNDPVLREFGL